MGMAWMTARVEWRRRWGSLALLALLITLAGAVPIAAVAGARRADTAFTRFGTATGEPEIQADGFGAPGAWEQGHDGAPDAFAAALEQPGVVGGQRYAAVAVAATEESDPFSFAIIGGEPAVPLIVDGRMFEVGDPHEGVVNESGAAAFGVGVGDTLEVRTVGWDQREEYIDDSGVGLELSGPRISVTVTGIIRNAIDIAQADDPFLTLGPAFVERYGGDVITCPCIDMFDVEQDHEEQAVDSIGSVYRDDEYVVDLEEGGDLPEHVANGIDVEVTAMRLLAVAAGLAGLIVVGQAIARQAAGSAGERATTTALGATSGQQTLMGVLAVLPAIVVGAIGSVLVAMSLSTLTPRGLAREAEIDPGLRIDAAVLAAGAAAVTVSGIVLTVLAARRSVRPGQREAPRFIGLPGGVGASGMLGIALATRPGRRGRRAAGSAVVAIVLGVVGVLGVWSFESGREHLSDDGRLFGVAADLAWRGAPDEVEQVIDVALATDGVYGVGVRWGADVKMQVTSSRGSTTGDPSSLDTVSGWTGPTIVRGRAAAGPDEVALGRKSLDELGIEIGDKVEVTGDGEGRAVLTVVGEVVAWGQDEVDTGFEMSTGGLRALMSVTCDGTFSCEPDLQYVLVAGDSDARTALVNEDFSPITLPSEIDNLEEAGALPWWLAAFLGALGVAGLLHAVVTVLRARRRDVAIGRALGLTVGGSRSAARWATATMAGVGVAVGVPLGIVVGRLVWARTADRLGVILEHGLPWWAPIVTAAGAVAITLVLAEIPARRTSHVPPALRAE
jgi:hypothetical protein